MRWYSRRLTLQTLGCVGVLGLAADSRGAPVKPLPGKQLTAGGIRKITDVPYGSGAKGAQTLDLYLPAMPPPRPGEPARASLPVPILFYFHGGAWISGDKEQYALLGLSLATQGIAVVLPNYRLAGEGGPRHPAQAQDAAAAVAWMRRHAADYGLDRERIVVGGHSAGAYLAAQLAFDPAFLAAVGEKPEALCGFVGLEGIYDLQQLVIQFPSYRQDFLVAAFGSEEALWRRASPQYLDHKLQRPWLIVHSLEDELVDVDQSKRFSVALSGKGVPVQYLLTPHGNHFGVVAQMSLPLSPLAGQVVHFVRMATERTAPVPARVPAPLPAADPPAEIHGGQLPAKLTQHT